MKSKDLGYNPPVFFWIAEYTDGSALAQFDPYTGKENLFGAVDHSRLKSFGWYPFSHKLASKVAIVTKVKHGLPQYVISVSNGQELVAYRRQRIHYGTLPTTTKSRETLYVLGIKNQPVMFIDEDGNVHVTTKQE